MPSVGFAGAGAGEAAAEDTSADFEHAEAATAAMIATPSKKRRFRILSS
jgi:hypothetical protein